MLNTNPLPIKSFANIFSYSVSRLHFVNGFFCYAKAFVSLGPICLFLLLFPLLLEVDQKKIMLQFTSKSALPMFSSRSFIVCCLTVRCLIHFECILVYGVRECSDFIV